MGGESLGTYSIEVDSDSRPLCAICAGVVSRLIVVSVTFSGQNDKSACDWDVKL